MNGLLSFVKAMGATRLIMMGGVLFGLIVFFWIILGQANQGDMQMLYTDLAPEESNEIAQQLSAQGIPFKIEAGGRTVLVPSDRVNQLRVSLASSGMGGHVTPGWEIFDKETGLGATNAQHLMNIKRATQGELQRAIEEIAGISAARVFIVMPERRPLAREAQEPSASVQISGRSVGKSVASSIQRLVANAVPGLSTDRVAVINSATGQVLASGGGTKGGALNTIEEQRTTLQHDLQQRIESLIGSSVGPENVRATVFVELTREQITRTTNDVDPDRTVETSRSTTESTSDEAVQEGGTVSAAENIPDGTQAEGSAGINKTSQSDEIVNLDYKRTQTQEIILPGTILRITAAVMVNNATDEVDAEGNSTYAPPSVADLQEFQTLVKRTIGYKSSWEETNPDGTIANNVVTVRPIRFSKPEPLEVGSSPVELFPGVRGEDLKGLLKTGITGLITIMVILLIVRPLVKRLIDAIPDAPSAEQLQAQQYEQLSAGQAADSGISAEMMAMAAAGDPEAAQQLQLARGGGATMPQTIESKIDVAQVAGRIQDSTLKKVGEIIQKSPEESVAIVRSWLYSD